MNLNFIGMVLILMILTLLTLSLLNTIYQKRKQKNNPQHYVDNVDSLNVSHEDFHKVVNFMLMYGVIDLDQYNQIMLKGLPYCG